MISYLTSIVILIIAWREASALLAVASGLFAIAGAISMSNVELQERDDKNAIKKND